jgi:hypothetical protein
LIDKKKEQMIQMLENLEFDEKNMKNEELF